MDRCTLQQRRRLSGAMCKLKDLGENRSDGRCALPDMARSLGGWVAMGVVKAAALNAGRQRLRRRRMWGTTRERKDEGEEGGGGNGDDVRKRQGVIVHPAISRPGPWVARTGVSTRFWLSPHGAGCLLTQTAPFCHTDVAIIQFAKASQHDASCFTCSAPV